MSLSPPASPPSESLCLQGIFWVRGSQLAGKDLDREVWDKSSSCQQIFEVFEWCGKDPDVHCLARWPSRLSRPPLHLPADPGLFVGVGIFSFARYGKDFYTSKYEGSVKVPQRTVSSDYSIFDNYYIPEITSVLLLRSCKVRCLEKSSFLKGLRWKFCFPQDYL